MKLDAFITRAQRFLEKDLAGNGKRWRWPYQSTLNLMKT
jgi:hypothetical protein